MFTGDKMEISPSKNKSFNYEARITTKEKDPKRANCVQDKNSQRKISLA